MAKVRRDSDTVKNKERSRLVGDDYSYNMNHLKRGTFLLINNKTFNAKTRMEERIGTDVDADKLESLGRTLGFDVIRRDNQTTGQMMALVNKTSKANHHDCDCFALSVLSHGDEGELYGTNGKIEVEELVAPMKNCTTLLGKPKLFIFQACRGSWLDEGRLFRQQQCMDAMTVDPARVSRTMVRVPLEADFLYAYSTVAGYYAWRNEDSGSWFIQALERMMLQYMFSLDLMSILTRVNHEVAYKFEANEAKGDYSKQMPSIVSMLTKDLYFKPKY